MKTLQTSTIPNPDALTGLPRLAYYNGMDCMLTAEIHRKLQLDFTPETHTTYRFMFALQSPVLDMMLRGTPIDKIARDRMITVLEASTIQLRNILNRFATALWNAPLNAGSWQQKGQFLYDFCRNEPIRKYDRVSGTMKITTNREALEKLCDRDVRILPIINTILAYQDARKALGILKSGIDPDGFMRSSYNIAGTETGRLASRQNAFGGGCVTEDHEVLTPDGWVPITTFPPVIAQWQLDEPIKFVAVQQWVGKSYCGRMVEIQNENVSLTMTEDHRVVLLTTNSHSIVPAVLLWDGHAKRFLRIPSGQKAKYHTISRACTNFFDVKRIKVYCPTVQSGMFHIRRQGKQCVTGNSNDQNWRESWRVIFAALPGSIPNRRQYNIPDKFRNLPPVRD